MNGKQLKNSILQWAIQGKLVPQNPNDEPASVLLENIRQEKERLIKEKKIKRDKNASVIYRGEDNSYYEKFLATGEVKCIDDEIPFEIPKGWEWVRIKHICSMQAGKNISASVISSEKNNDYQYRCIGGNGLRGYVRSFNQTGSHAIVGRQGALCGCLNLEEGQFYATEHAVVVDTYGVLSSLFMYYFLTALNLNQYATATAQPGLAVSNIIEVLFPLPPKEEQERIIERLETVHPAIIRFDKSNIALDLLNKNIKDQLKKSLLQEAIQGKLVPQIAEEGTAQALLEQIRQEKRKLVKEGKLKKSALVDSTIYKGDDNKYYEQVGEEVADISSEIPFELPTAWTWCRLRDICQIMTGATFKKDEANNSGVGVRVLRGGNISPFKLQLKTDDLYVPTDKVKETILLKKNDIVTPAVTSLENIGKMAIVSDDLHNITVGGFVFIIRCHLKSTAFAEHLQYIMSAPATIEFMQSITNKFGQAFYNIGKERLSAALIPIPPLGEVQRINDKIKTLFSLS